MKSRRAHALAQRAEEVVAGGAASLDELDALLTDCAGLLLSIRAELRRTDRRLHEAQRAAVARSGPVTEAEWLAGRIEELDTEGSELSELIKVLRQRRDRFAASVPPSGHRPSGIRRY